MKVPKFYRWLSERYPLVNQAVDEGSLLPEVDNLYLDMNGIIHTATHGNDGVSKKLKEKDVILIMMAYIDREGPRPSAPRPPGGAGTAHTTRGCGAPRLRLFARLLAHSRRRHRRRRRRRSRSRRDGKNHQAGAPALHGH